MFPAPAAAARDVCQSLTKASGSNFSLAFRFLPKPQRQALYAIYAFCRVTDDLVDEGVPPVHDGTLESSGAPFVHCTTAGAICLQFTVKEM